MEPLRAVLDYCAARIGCEPVPVGDGHPVVVYPGLAGGSMSTAHLRQFIQRSGFIARDWERGVNTGPEGDFDDWLSALVEHVRALHDEHGRTVSLVGWSLGGLYARLIARQHPDAITRVITLGSPFRTVPGEESHPARFIRMGAERQGYKVDPSNLLTDDRPLPVPSPSPTATSSAGRRWRSAIREAAATSPDCAAFLAAVNVLNGIVRRPRTARPASSTLATACTSTPRKGCWTCSRSNAATARSPA